MPSGHWLWFWGLSLHLLQELASQPFLLSCSDLGHQGVMLLRVVCRLSTVGSEAGLPGELSCLACVIYPEFQRVGPLSVLFPKVTQYLGQFLVRSRYLFILEGQDGMI